MVWGESSEGTIGVGSCVAEGRPLTIHGDQHFMTCDIGLSCAVAPIWDTRGRLIATLDVSTYRADLTPAILKLVVTAKRADDRRMKSGLADSARRSRLAKCCFSDRSSFASRGHVQSRRMRRE
ncbi:GAF domain-containing protein [Bosea sp. (in: a-proteobacteria)]|jgi:transcriptional regulator of acetoin/glycerol metabolism|uniref:GAF domain-containing protein n=1 Tax=Bosea sp. (in: a-proteobacteria) TaxID=1871050 RepID=UPI0039C89C9B